MKQEPLNMEKVRIFFDESGSNNIKQRPTLMAGLLIPEPIYQTTEYKEMNSKLKERKYMPLHWTEYSGYMPLKRDIISVIDIFIKYSRVCKMNIINYDETSLRERRKFYDDKDLSKRMIYTKLPERILYGLLRNYGKDVNIKAELYIENSSTYTKLELDKILVDQLNTQSMYRGEQFKVSDCNLTPKKNEIGVEIVDLLMGFVRTIIQNKKERLSKGERMRNALVLQFLESPIFYSFLSDIKYYEWQSSRELTNVRFKEYVDLFLASHYSTCEKTRGNMSTKNWEFLRRRSSHRRRK
ncbi:DUF3800 domain-containing protein [Terribacillus sp. DMT04]|uniref:DUF3800 domain-containing protein n=1 Tax=Terribacillus sp. DMT04 TaxID=2850441 RepID=UPI001C2C6B31|nr:DUF3800 domain-containing protein [Terribacillus sp. DMT04]QXE01350.1 DUF3800 domain-containing protein [Terribacillus sp. DMT04]